MNTCVIEHYFTHIFVHILGTLAKIYVKSLDPRLLTIDHSAFVHSLYIVLTQDYVQTMDYTV